MHGQQTAQNAQKEQTSNYTQLDEVQLNVQCSLLNLRHPLITALPALFALLTSLAGVQCEEMDKHYRQYAIRREFAQFEQDLFCCFGACLMFGCIPEPSGECTVLVYAQ